MTNRKGRVWAAKDSVLMGDSELKQCGEKRDYAEPDPQENK